ncbi:Alpha/beta-Hydrolases superfamily protein [Rhynchospora pubera]|uniref:Alpha/beta-Hydrolases superfamily protein n=1 Tax=Rhynchospora pubera TaxID=906938 RepID=A0AAV8DW89_9POAL|nr:Alpha/beta-Hydrolases superfamily protein [Rhynchospora pubera]
MALATSSLITTKPLVRSKRTSNHTATATVAELPHVESPFPNIALTLSNFLHLSTTATANQDDQHERDHSTSDPTSTMSTVSPARLKPLYSQKEDISSLFPAIHGKADWSSLLHPLHPGLRREIIKYGEFAQATYDAFDYNPFSEYCGSCLFSQLNLFSKLGLDRHGYNITKYIYAMSHIDLPQWLEKSLHGEAWSRDSNWMGFVAVSGDEESTRIGCRDITVAWRGTVAPAEWCEDLQNQLKQLGPEGDAKVEQGFHSLYTSKSDSTRYNKSSASEQVMTEIKRLVNYYRDKGERVSLTITGHSLGGALALLNAHEAATAIPDLPVSVISFGAPRVGNDAFRNELDRLGVKALRVVVKQDLVPKTPGIIFNEGLKRMESMTGSLDWVYMHVGFELSLDIKSSPYLKKGLDFSGFHSLETYLHLVDGFVGPDSEFRSNAKRDLALVNKSSGLLRDELSVPVCWYNNKRIADERQVSLRWGRPNREKEDMPVPLPC